MSLNTLLVSTESQGEQFVESTFQQHFINYKIALIGEKGTGKQTFVKHWVATEKDGYKSKNSNTLFLPQTKDNYELEFECVDIDTKDKKFVFGKYDGYLLMFGVDTSISHIEALYKYIVKETNLSFKVDKYPVALVGTKKDIPEEQIKVQTLAALKMSDKFKCSYVETSCIEEEGVDIAVEEIIKQIEIYRKTVQQELEKKHKKNKRKSPVPFLSSVANLDDQLQ
eukprot:gene2810-4218_t